MAGVRLAGERVSLKDLAYRSLRSAVVDLQLAPGETVTEEGLASGLGVSRSILRETMQQLHTDGLLVRLPNGRLRVSPTSVEEVHNLYIVRSALARVAVEEAVTRLTDDDLELLRDALDQFRTDSGIDDTSTLVRSGTRFHDLIFEIAGNPVTIAVMNVIQPRLDRYRHISVESIEGRPGRSLGELERVFAAFEAGDAAAAVEAMSAHIAESELAVVAALTTSEPDAETSTDDSVE
ncbi:hypothetical protein GCM10009775_07390 [Microbacterium aoyamense]|uniref:HTH gntR-type domain-containing protein n=1 Tax=Microbacterium aoyamense TaxID=344166 RepID=A0ABP5APW5_9MICO|nr:GntR family transcriptional regulator [Microbacterium aoyamense]